MPDIPDMPQDNAQFVARHDPGVARDVLVEEVRRRITELDKLRESLQERPVNLKSFVRKARALAGLYHALKPDAPEVIVFLRLLARAIAADGARYGDGDGPVRVDLGKSGAIDIPRAQRWPPTMLRLGDIVDGYHAALAAGDRPAFELLAQVPAARLTRTPPTTVERVYLLQHVLGLQSLARGDVAGHALLVEALKGTNASEMVQGARDFALFIASP